MKQKSQLTFLILFYIQISLSIAQTLPIKWLNNSYNINIDTVSVKRTGIGSLGYYARTNFVHYRFINIGSHVTFIDSIPRSSDKFITKPNDIQTVSLDFHLFKGLELSKKRDTTVFLILPFYYEGKIYNERVTCSLTLGKSKLISHDSLKIDATNRVAEIVGTDSISEFVSLRFTHYFTIKNISKKPIYCTKKLTAWNDSQALRSQNNIYEEILPGKTYKIPAEMNMDKKLKFFSTGIIEVFADDISEIFECQIISKFEKTNKLINTSGK